MVGRALSKHRVPSYFTDHSMWFTECQGQTSFKVLRVSVSGIPQVFYIQI